MAVETLSFLQPTGTASDRTPSGSIWANCPWEAIGSGQRNGVRHFFDFDTLPKTPPTTEGNFGDFAAFSDTGGFISAGTGPGGEWVFGSNDDNEGASIRSSATPFSIVRTAGYKFWFEARVKKSTIANTTFEMFLGLMEDAALTAIVPITTTAATLADKNLLGFYSTESTGANGFTTFKTDGNAAVSVGANEVTFAANTYVKLGMTFQYERDNFIADPTGAAANKYLVKFYQNGYKLASHYQVLATAGNPFPNDVGLGLVFAVRNAAGSSPGNATIDWWKAAQVFS